jgi:hypothetical protein
MTASLSSSPLALSFNNNSRGATICILTTGTTTTTTRVDYKTSLARDGVDQQGQGGRPCCCWPPVALGESKRISSLTQSVGQLACPAHRLCRVCMWTCTFSKPSRYLALWQVRGSRNACSGNGSTTSLERPLHAYMESGSNSNICAQRLVLEPTHF